MKGTNGSPKWRRLLIAATLAAAVVLGLAVTLALAQQELPGSVNAFIQTSGPNTWLAIGDWYTNNNTVAPPGAGPGGNSPHRFAIFVPCNIPPASPLTVELFDPEIWPGTISIDEIRNDAHDKVTDPTFADDATFTLLDPNGSVVVSTTYPPTAATSDQWVEFATFTRGAFDCAPGEASVVYTLLVSTSNNDDNDWRLRITHPDNIPGSGDEPTLATFETSFQHAGPAGATSCQDFFFYVKPGTPSITLNNFDLDADRFLGPEAPSVTYFLPDGTSTAGTTSDDAVWNNGTSTTRGGDVFPNPPVGWWRAEICVAPDNQYIFEPETAFLLEPPLLPDPALSHVCSSSGQSQIIRYTIDFGNTSTDGAAFGPDLTFNLPAGTTFESCSGGLSCSESAPGVVTFALFPVLPAGAATQVTVDVRLGAGTPDPLISTAQFEYLDVFSNVYPPLVDTFQAQISECADEPTVVDIDIKPGSDPNSINCNNAEAVITVAILSTDEFDASNVDHATVTFGGASEKHIDKKSGEPRRHEEDVDDDGDADLVFHFRMGDTDLSCDSEDGTLGGETYDGQTIVGTDAVRMVDRGGGNR